MRWCIILACAVTSGLALPGPAQVQSFDGPDDSRQSGLEQTQQQQQQLLQGPGDDEHSASLLTAQLRRRDATSLEAGDDVADRSGTIIRARDGKLPLARSLFGAENMNSPASKTMPTEKRAVLRKREGRRRRRRRPSRNDIYAILFNTVTFLSAEQSSKFRSCVQWRKPGRLIGDEQAIDIAVCTYYALGDITMEEIHPDGVLERQLRARLEHDLGGNLEDQHERTIIDGVISMMPKHDPETSPGPEQPNQFQELKGGLESLANRAGQSWSEHFWAPPRNNGPPSRIQLGEALRLRGKGFR